MRLSPTIPGMLQIQPGLSLHRSDVRAILAVDREALQHYAEHGTLPVDAPVWPGVRLDRLSTGHTGWHVVTPGGKLIATVTQPLPPGGCWSAAVHGPTTQHPPSCTYTGDTAQEAVDKARAALAAFWGLST
jgi:hypothetical protein